MRPGFDAATFARATDVSRETLAKLEAYEALLTKWQRRINLVSPNTLPDLWQRHMLDSAQLAPILKEMGRAPIKCVDMGTGAGFPGMVLAIMGVGTWTLIDSDQRKIAFLQEVARITETAVDLHSIRLETLRDQQFDVVTARAVAPLTVLLGYAAPLMHSDGRAVLLKGSGAEAEVDEARQSWSFDVDARASVTDKEAKLLIIQNVMRK